MSLIMPRKRESLTNEKIDFWVFLMESWSVMALNVIVNMIVGMLTFFLSIFFCGKSPTLCANFLF